MQNQVKKSYGHILGVNKTLTYTLDVSPTSIKLQIGIIWYSIRKQYDKFATQCKYLVFKINMPALK